MALIIEGMLDKELNAALKVRSGAWRQYHDDPARSRGVPVSSVGLLAALRALEAEARSVPDPGGPLTNYIDALRAWAATHPEIDSSELWAIMHPLIREQR